MSTGISLRKDNWNRSTRLLHYEEVIGRVIGRLEGAEKLAQEYNPGDYKKNPIGAITASLQHAESDLNDYANFRWFYPNKDLVEILDSELTERRTQIYKIVGDKIASRSAA